MLRRLLNDQAGTSAVEFAIVASVISLAALGAFKMLGEESNNQMSGVESAYAEVN
ncbi:Flp family type IVb pilin [Qipengyuania sp. CAU 1752]